MTTGPEHEARRRVRNHRILAASAIAAVSALAAIVVTLTASRSRDGEAPNRTTTSAPRSTTVATATWRSPRPAASPPAGTAPDPASPLVLVDRTRNLPPDWAPPDLVDTHLAFPFEGPNPKRMLRADAAHAIDLLSTGAARNGVPIMGLSGFRSEQAQQDLHAAYVGREGLAAASTFSAKPGHSEHQTGLAIDVMATDQGCPAEPCFAFTPQARWLAEHAHEYGFIVRYPQGKEDVTSYQAEPWHLRYVGVAAATEMADQGLTLEEYLRAA